ncbi:MAG: carboxypeptidase regulatory-like domain-containing protein [Proteobacteria bacterium]|jgi:predicted small secreted protein|nr:carboxypeptidase regulatory-like domain-containing protein [Pseudomonadota bacterium]
MLKNIILRSIGVFACATALAACNNNTGAGQEVVSDMAADSASGPATEASDIAGTVTSAAGPEAGVWVIAETDAFDTFYAKVVVTNHEGQYLIPDLPAANYQLWVRGYGLSDSEKTASQPGDTVALTAIVAPDAATAAQVYPAAYWYSMMHLPPDDAYGAVNGGKNGYLMWMKNMGCAGCHQLGQLSTRTLPDNIGEFETSAAAWMRRVSSGQAGDMMVGQLSRATAGLAPEYLADWTDRVAAGQLPHTTPERPSGLERNVVATIRDWSRGNVYMHDLSGTDRRNPTVNAYGKIYGAPELSTDEMPVLDPINNTATIRMLEVRDEDTPTTNDAPVIAPSPYWGDEAIWDSQANAHNPMLDQDGRVWLTSRIRGPETPDYCREGSDHPSAQLFTVEETERNVSVYDPETDEFQFVDTCFSTHHLHFAEDENNTLWTSGGDQVVGWVDTNKFLETGDSAASQGWSPLILDINANGQIDEWVEPDEAIDPAKDKRIPADFYAVMPNPADGSVWGTNAFAFPGALIRYDPVTGLGEIFRPPLPGFGIRGADIDRNGVIWASMGSGHMGEFDRRKCTGPLNGPEATGDHCPEGWTFYDYPGPGFANYPDFSVESSYYTWVDQRNSLGLGDNTPISTGNLFDGVHALVDGEFVTMRIPYPLGFYSKGFEGRIDDPDAGWKGRGLWVPEGDRTPWLKETGKGSRPLVVHFQMRPDPLAN